MIEFRRVPANFTHRINRLSFGHHASSLSLVSALEGDETFVPDEETTVQYFLTIVPTEIHNMFSTINTFQYSVTENIRKLGRKFEKYLRNKIIKFIFRFRKEFLWFSWHLF